MKKRKMKLCPKCSGILKIEKDKYLKKYYTSGKYCQVCDENYFSFEVIKLKKKKV